MHEHEQDTPTPPTTTSKDPTLMSSPTPAPLPPPFLLHLFAFSPTSLVAPPVVLCLKFSAHSLPLAYTLFLAILHSLALPVCLVVATVGLPRSAAEVVLLAEVVYAYIEVLFFKF